MEGLPAAVLNRLSKEIRDLLQKPCEGIKLLVNEDNIADVQAELEGPAGTPYEGGVFKLKLVLGANFPEAPPKGYFITRIFHPNVSSSGEICVNVLKKDWTPDMGLRHVLVVVRCLLIEPFPESALNEEAGRLLMEDYEEYAKHARLMTSIHAQALKRTTPLTASGGANAVNSGAAGDAATADGGSPSARKSKAGVDKKTKAVAAKKRSLKRL